MLDGLLVLPSVFTNEEVAADDDDDDVEGDSKSLASCGIVVEFVFGVVVGEVDVEVVFEASDELVAASDLASCSKLMLSASSSSSSSMLTSLRSILGLVLAGVEMVVTKLIAPDDVPLLCPPPPPIGDQLRARPLFRGTTDFVGASSNVDAAASSAFSDPVTDVDDADDVVSSNGT